MFILFKKAFRTEFLSLIGDLLCQPEVWQMDDIRQHNDNVSCLDHSIFVSYIAYRLAKRFDLDATSAARAGLLHDLYLCDWSTTDIGQYQRLLIHPEMAARNAAQFGLSDIEKDAILTHMWPVTITKLPSNKISVVVNLADKFCATAEFLGLYRVIGASDNLVAFNLRKSPQPVTVQ